MIIAITSKGNSEKSLIDSRFGRCAYFAIYDTETQKLDFIENPSLDAEEGAGPAAVSCVAKLGVTKIVSGEFGIKIKGLINDLKIQMIMIKQEKTIQDIIALLISKQE